MSEASSSGSSVDIEVAPGPIPESVEIETAARAAARAPEEQGTDSTEANSSDTSHVSADQKKCVIQLKIDTRSPFHSGFKIDIEVLSVDWQTVRLYTEEGVTQEVVEHSLHAESRILVESSSDHAVKLQLEIKKKPFPLQWQGPGRPQKRLKRSEIEEIEFRNKFK